MVKTYIFIFLLFPLGLCAQVKIKSTVPSIEGTASFYNDSFEGLETANGDIFKHKRLTAASNNFNLNSWVRVTNLRNKRSVIVRIIDRMHPRMARKGRVVDLSKKAANKIKIIGSGLAKVKVELVPAGTED